MDSAYKKLLEKQGYRFVGEHSAVKICEWTRRSIKGEGCCYKERFYGIKSNQCCQLSVAVNFCDKDCIYCWREHRNFPFSKIDNPEDVLKQSQFYQNKLLDGFKGFSGINMKKYLESREIKSYAISLTGENLYYPRLNELIKLIKSKNKPVFLVMHGGNPSALRKLEMPTQLYLSMDAPSEKMFYDIQRPASFNAWKDYLESLKILKKLRGKTRTVIRLTLIKNVNMDDVLGYAKLIKIAEPDFIEVKAYMWMGASKKRLAPRNSPLHSEVAGFCKNIVKLIDYNIVDEQAVSKVVLLGRIGLKKKRKILN